MMDWYALRLQPGATRPSRHDERFTNVEWSMKRDGMECYVPMDFVLKIHHRTKKPIDKKFPIIPGYAFMEAPEDQNWEKVRDCDFVAAVIGAAGKPLPIPDEWMIWIRELEEQRKGSYFWMKEQRALQEERKNQKVTRRVVAENFPVGGIVTIGEHHRLFAGHQATVVAATGRNTVKLIVETLNCMANVEIPIDLVELAS